MGKYLRYEDSNWRTYKIDTTASTIKRPKKHVTKEDLFGAIFEVDGELCTAVSVSETSSAVTAYILVAGEATAVVYTKATDAFSLGETALTGTFIDEFGREEMFI